MKTALALLLAVVTLCSPAFGWGESGHKLVASIAFRQLTKDERTRIVAILEHHPRFKTDFQDKLPSDLAAPTDRQEWLFHQAALWPDLVRNYPDELKMQYHRSTWHYINRPHFLSDADRTALLGQLRINLSLDPPAQAADDMNAVQVIRYARLRLKSPDAAAEEKGLLLSWLFHIVGDIHQPLHSTALFTGKLYPLGDRGGNSIPVEQRFNLHALWDLFPGTSMPFAEARNKAIADVNDSAMSALGKQAAQKLDETVWLDESHSLAVTQVYQPEIVAVLRQWDADNRTTDLPPIVVSEAYLKAGGRLSRQRIVEAGYRLGAVLKEIAR